MKKEREAYTKIVKALLGSLYKWIIDIVHACLFLHVNRGCGPEEEGSRSQKDTFASYMKWYEVN